MAERLKLKSAARVLSSEPLYEGYEIGKNYIVANVGVDKIEAVLQHFILMQNEHLFFILELPATAKAEEEIAPGIVDATHKDIYYIDGCSREDALVILFRVGNLLYQDGISAFGFGCHESGDEIIFGKYNVLHILSRDIEKYRTLFAEQDIEQMPNLLTAPDTFSPQTPGISELYKLDGKTVYDIPDQFADWGMYLARQRVEDQS